MSSSSTAPAGAQKELRLPTAHILDASALIPNPYICHNEQTGAIALEMFLTGHSTSVSCQTASRASSGADTTPVFSLIMRTHASALVEWHASSRRTPAAGAVGTQRRPPRPTST